MLIFDILQRVANNFLEPACLAAPLQALVLGFVANNAKYMMVWCLDFKPKGHSFHLLQDGDELRRMVILLRSSWTSLRSPLQWFTASELFVNSSKPL